jgi:hypothetical protein
MDAAVRTPSRHARRHRAGSALIIMGRIPRSLSLPLSLSLSLSLSLHLSHYLHGLPAYTRRHISLSAATAPTADTVTHTRAVPRCPPPSPSRARRRRRRRCHERARAQDFLAPGERPGLERGADEGADVVPAAVAAAVVAAQAAVAATAAAPPSSRSSRLSGFMLTVSRLFRTLRRPPRPRLLLLRWR